jgi:hypothetical protein
MEFDWHHARHDIVCVFVTTAGWNPYIRKGFYNRKDVENSNTNKDNAIIICMRNDLTYLDFDHYARLSLWR